METQILTYTKCKRLWSGWGGDTCVKSLMNKRRSLDGPRTRRNGAAEKELHDTDKAGMLNEPLNGC